MERKYVVAGNHAQYRLWLQQKGFDPHEYVYVPTAERFRGLSNPHGFFIGTYNERNDIDEIKLQIKLAQR
jgi:hypothetical protein